MKKQFIIPLSLICIFGFTSCNNKAVNPNEEPHEGYRLVNGVEVTKYENYFKVSGKKNTVDKDLGTYLLQNAQNRLYDAKSVIGAYSLNYDSDSYTFSGNSEFIPSKLAISARDKESSNDGTGIYLNENTKQFKLFDNELRVAKYTSNSIKQHIDEFDHLFTTSNITSDYTTFVEQAGEGDNYVIKELSSTNLKEGYLTPTSIITEKAKGNKSELETAFDAEVNNVLYKMKSATNTLQFNYNNSYRPQSIGSAESNYAYYSTDDNTIYGYAHTPVQTAGLISAYTESENRYIPAYLNQDILVKLSKHSDGNWWIDSYNTANKAYVVTDYELNEYDTPRCIASEYNHFEIDYSSQGVYEGPFDTEDEAVIAPYHLAIEYLPYYHFEEYDEEYIEGYRKFDDCKSYTQEYTSSDLKENDEGIYDISTFAKKEGYIKKPNQYCLYGYYSQPSEVGFDSDDKTNGLSASKASSDRYGIEFKLVNNDDSSDSVTINYDDMSFYLCQEKPFDYATAEDETDPKMFAKYDKCKYEFVIMFTVENGKVTIDECSSYFINYDCGSSLNIQTEAEEAYEEQAEAKVEPEE